MRSSSGGLLYGILRDVFVGSAIFSGRPMKMVAALTNTIPVDPDAHLLCHEYGAYGLKKGTYCIFRKGDLSTRTTTV